MNKTSNAERSRRIPSADIVAAYKATGSVWRAGKQLGIAGQLVHERLRDLDYKMLSRNWTKDEEAELASLVAANLTITAIGDRLGRPYAGVACKVTRLGLGVPGRRPHTHAGRVAKRAATQASRGNAMYGEEASRTNMGLLEQSGLRPTVFARKNGLAINRLASALQTYEPERWYAYSLLFSTQPPRPCEYCSVMYSPANGKQRFCTRRCRNDAAADNKYFGGRRRSTYGLAERTCQLCYKVDVPGLSSHHVVGKEHDPDSLCLVALCPGCHQMVGHAAGRDFLETEEGWERFMGLVIGRHFGGDENFGTAEVCVDIKYYTRDEADQMLAMEQEARAGEDLMYKAVDGRCLSDPED